MLEMLVYADPRLDKHVNIHTDRARDTAILSMPLHT